MTLEKSMACGVQADNSDTTTHVAEQFKQLSKWLVNGGRQGPQCYTRSI